MFFSCAGKHVLKQWEWWLNTSSSGLMLCRFGFSCDFGLEVRRQSLFMKWVHVGLWVFKTKRKCHTDIVPKHFSLQRKLWQFVIIDFVSYHTPIVHGSTSTFTSFFLINCFHCPPTCDTHLKSQTDFPVFRRSILYLSIAQTQLLTITNVYA